MTPSLLAGEVLVRVPGELTPEQRLNFVRNFSRELADRYGNAADFSVHVPAGGSRCRRLHALAGR